MSQRIEAIVKFFREVGQEMKRVTWPTRQEVINLTLVVVVTTLIISAFLGVVDYGLSQGVQAILQISN